MRMSLGKILLQFPDLLLLLDEPTNHLRFRDDRVVGKLPQKSRNPDGNYLTRSRVSRSVVQFDRRNRTRRFLSTYLGNYSTYLAQKAESQSAQLSAFERQQKELEKQQAFVEKFRASATRSTQAKSREKLLDKVERIAAPASSMRTLNFRFPPAPRSGREVVTIDNLEHVYDDKILFLGTDLFIESGDRIAFLGPNGCGKSTLLKIIVGMEQQTGGTVKLGEHNVIPSYFEQNQAEALDLDRTVMETIHDEVPDWKNEEVRTLLGRFLFSGDTVFKKVGSLSGGEKARLALAKMLLIPANLLILDEPTNHLDIPAKEMLEDALVNYDGTALIVSHDRYFISQVANKIVEVRDGEFRVYLGDYHYYLDKLEEEREQAKQEAFVVEQAAKKAAKAAKAGGKKK